jgi:hypothetical protein
MENDFEMESVGTFLAVETKVPSIRGQVPAMYLESPHGGSSCMNL